MQSLKNGLNKVLEVICIVLFAFITIVGTYQIVARYVFNAPSTISEELLTYSFTWMSFLAAALVFGKREHMRMEFIADKFKGKAGIMLSIISEIIVLVFALLILVYGGSAITKLTVLQVTASLGISMSYIYAIVPISGVIVLIYNVINIIQFVSQLNGESK
ncbi:TRAP transporter small permease [Clostridium thermopalmarium]|uniref:2,3-diketo-L-gulonate TRAP transporter small permease protein YiaM n=1 Tax=Clostridium thermopalmarium DSM 5974 TaxID=1121340 RepID=A0A2T0AXQ6_9CLOT|nr:TRAP transporter small permease [Clostridium thermopalmarium]PRR75673.1 2,3-diketo-L-gulonate TRAP transporter small permease protein YiaM [Clostridium thermopalmarium DSM 5974]PVZ26639.1 TRAP-type C4-dicarboxylate transport system permease small subunit [Clostridium thermopalmarium DSM 5974]